MKKYIIGSLLLLACFIRCISSDAQPYCYNCNYDSLVKVKERTTSAGEKIRLLTLLVEKRLGPGARPINHLDELIQLSSQVKTFNVAPYVKIREGFSLERKKNWTHALLRYQEAVELFDKQQKVICNLLFQIMLSYTTLNRPDEQLKYFQKKLADYQVNGPVENTAICYYASAGYYSTKFDYNTAISYRLKAAELFKAFYNRLYLFSLNSTGSFYVGWGNYDKAQEYFKTTLPMYLLRKDSIGLSSAYAGLVKIAIKKKNYEEAKTFALHQLQYGLSNTGASVANVNLAAIHLEKEEPTLALPYLFKAQHLKDSAKLPFNTAAGLLEINYYLSMYYQQLHQKREAEKYLLAAYKEAVTAQSTEVQLKYLQALNLFYAGSNKAAEAYRYAYSYYALKDSLEQQLGAYYVAHYEHEQKEIAQNNRINALRQEAAIKESTIKQRNVIIWISALALLLIGASLVFLYRQLQINKKTLNTLRKTQRQLIQQEKMASLGELTAGIAHEIQNPLNFINNFSEVSVELLKEAKVDIAAERKQEAMEVVNDAQENLQKVVHHGRRADAIVKSMLEHSRASKGEKQPTDINVLVDEYLKLSYHGLRAKDDSFNAILETHFDPLIGKTEIIPQDIGSVLRNLFNNAFYAVCEKKRVAGNRYEPIIQVTTQKQNGRVEIRVKDNGTGIPEKVLDKIYQPFFTTKPTGQGTGLGLSLSYDIITKAYGGEMKVETTEGEGSEFIIHLPCKTKENEK